MARVAWEFNSYNFPINPEEDSGWVKEIVLSERTVINATQSNIQIGGFKSETRTISGWIWGPSANTHYSNYQSWLSNKTQATLIDHNGVSKTAMLIEFKPTAVSDPRQWAAGRQTWRYSAKFIAI